MTDTNIVEQEPKAPPPPYNRAAFRRHALKVSKETHRKFDRVSQDFFIRIEAEIEANFRSLRADLVNTPFGPVEVTENFLTSEGKRKLVEAFNRFIGKAIYRAVNQTRVGKTL